MIIYHYYLQVVYTSSATLLIRLPHSLYNIVYYGNTNYSLTSRRLLDKIKKIITAFNRLFNIPCSIFDVFVFYSHAYIYLHPIWFHSPMHIMILQILPNLIPQLLSITPCIFLIAAWSSHDVPHIIHYPHRVYLSSQPLSNTCLSTFATYEQSLVAPQ